MSTSPKTTPVSTRAIVLRALLRNEEGALRVLRLVVLTASSIMHAVGHAGLALLGGAVVSRLGGVPPGTSGSTLLAVRDPLALALAAIVVSTLRLVGHTAGAYVSARMVGDVSTALRGHVLRGLFAVHRLRHPRQSDHGRACTEAGAHARAVSALTVHVREVATAIESAVGAGRAALQIAFLAAVVLFVAPRLFLAAAVILAPFAWLLGRVRRRLRTIQRAEMMHAASLLEASDEAVRHGELWQSFGAERKIASVLARLGREASRRSARLALWSTAQTGANELLGIAVFAAGLWALARFSPGDGARFAPFAVPFFLAYRPLRDLAEARIALGRGAEAARDLDVVLAHADADAQANEEKNDDVVATPARWTLGELVIRGFAHPHARFAPLDLRVAPGSIVALLAPTGWGKTTLLRALLGLDGEASGTVQYAGKSLDGVAPGPHARPFAWVPQEAPVLAASLAENVALAPRRPDRDEVDAHALLRDLGATTLLELDADGERLGASHRALSGGERQWLAIARALASDQPVLLLDEPTSGLDPDAEAAVLMALARLRGTRTMLIVTHREAPCAIADAVVRLDHLGGRVVTGAWMGSGTQRKLSSNTLES